MVKWKIIEKVVSQLLEQVSVEEEELSDRDISKLREEVRREVEKDLHAFKQRSIERDIKMQELDEVQNRRRMVEGSSIMLAATSGVLYLADLVTQPEMWAGVLGVGAVGGFLAHTLHQASKEKKEELRELVEE
jgi:uncharacterized membrane protein YdbT with pleckstrin-like domain